MYADDNEDKRARFLDILNETDYIFISSSRQWGTTTRLPERHPLTSAYYRYLLGCPDDRTIEWCYTVAEEDTFEGQLGFALVKIVDRNPAIGPFEINDQFSEEAFTVYDHPKVFIFQKAADYDPERVSELLGAVDLSRVVRVPPAEASGRPAPSLLLSEESRERQQAGGTWSQLYNVDALFNRFPALAVPIWYAAVALLGLFSYPLVRLGFSGLEDKGYPLARGVGLLLLAYLSWMSGSLGIGYTRPVIAAALLLIVAAGAFFGFRQRDELREELQSKWRYFLSVEAIFLVFFTFDLLIRLGNPDLWHPAFGGEKPMDFAYFNAILKSTTFPPYDPWFAGGYINYYYYGFVYVGTLVKLLGIVPAIAYNLVLPTLFGLMALGIFSIAWNLFLRSRAEEAGQEDAETKNGVSPWLVGIAAALLMAVLGNLGSLRMVLQGFQRLGAEGLYDIQAALLTKSVWALRGFTDVLLGESLPYGIGSWYWDPTRIMPPGDPAITEFPFFTVIYADPHAHLFALPITLIALAWALSVIFGKAWGRDGKLHWGMAGWSLLLGALAIGALRTTNTWDMPAYLVLGALAVLYSVWRYAQPSLHESLHAIPPAVVRGALGALMAGLLVVLALGLYQPYHAAYAQPDTNPIPHLGPFTPTSSYLVHWGVFLFVLISWMVWETRQWLAATPLSALRKVAPYTGFIAGSVLVAAGGILWLQLSKNVNVAWLALPLMIWAGVLLFRPAMPETRRIALFLVGTGLFLTLGVELYVIDSRMNTVFKFYLQAWTMFSAVGAAALGWIFAEIRMWLPRWRAIWQIALAGFFISAALFPLLGGLAKVNDRMAPDAPHTLNGMAYMPYATYADQGQTMQLSQDYAAIQWMQQNVPGSPVIVEAQTPTYRWGSRFAIYTGLPTIMGWDVHQSQQRGKVNGSQIGERIQAVRDFYQTSDLGQARDFLSTFEVRYIVVGQLERAYYPGDGLNKFEAQDGILWQEVFREGDTVIYEVLPDGLAQN
jgi:YYY domain-containing protein